MILHQVLISLVEVGLFEIRERVHAQSPINVSANEIADEIVAYLKTVPPATRILIEDALVGLDFPFGAFSNQPLDARVQMMRRGRWDGPAWLALSYALSICWLVTFSKKEVRDAIGAQIKPFPDDNAALDQAANINVRADLSADYDVCVVGSGAGGAMVAFRLGAQGKRVLLIDSGKWIPPQDLTNRHDIALATLYKTGGVQVAVANIAQLLQASQVTGINVLQANVFGGGPYVNNAVQLPLERDRFDPIWKARGFPLDWPEIENAMKTVASELKFDLSSLPGGPAGDPHAKVRPGERSLSVSTAALALSNQNGGDNPVSMWDCIGCGGCNTGCRYNHKTGGVHGPRAAGAPKSYLMRAIEDTNGNVKLRSELRALRFVRSLKGRVQSLAAKDLTTGKEVSVRAKAFVLAAGPVASSRILQQSNVRSIFHLFPVGHGLAANVTTPVNAVMKKSIGGSRPDPGTQMCFYSSPETGILLEGWFDYPASLAAGLQGLPQDVASIIGDYTKFNACGVVIPVDDIMDVNAVGLEITARLKDKDFTRILRAIAHAACALYDAGAESVFPGHRLNTNRTDDISISFSDAKARNIDAIVAYLRERLQGPQNLSLQTAHPQGGNAMALSPDHGIVSKEFKVFDTSNLFVADSSLFPAACGKNPQLTTLALAHLASNSILSGLNNHTLDAVAH